MLHTTLEARPESLRYSGDTGTGLFEHDSSKGGYFLYNPQKLARRHEVGLQG